MERIPKEIVDYYMQLESIKSFDRWDLLKQMRPLKEVFDFKWNQKLNAENICMRFVLNNGDLTSDFYSVDDKGQEKGFPIFDVFSPEQIEYLKSRARKTKNLILLARYNHILFKISQNRIFGIAAIKAYKSILNTGLNSEQIFLTDAIIKLTERTKFDLDITKCEFITLIKSEEIKLVHKHHISNLILNSNIFKSHELEFFPELALDWVTKSVDESYSLNKLILLNAIKVCINNKINTDIYYEKLAENELIVLKQHPDNSDFVRTHILGEIIDYYKKAKNIKKCNKYLKEYTEAKSQIELKAFDISPDERSQKILNEELNRSVKIILSWDLDKILYHYSIHSPLFPDINVITEDSEKKIKNSFLQFASASVFDINNNVKILSDYENLKHDIHFSYQYSFGLGVLPEFIRVMQIGAINGCISYYSIYEYLSTKSWLGQNIPESRMRSTNSGKVYNWLNLMAPALHSFLIQLETSFLINERLTYTNWILPIDSLTLKFEGALREFIKLIGGNASKLKRNELQEMLLDDLLDCETAKKVFSIHDLTLFKMIFTKNGDNIRHNVAHGFYHPQDYSMENCCKIFLCILRLSAYKLKSKQDNK